MQKKPNRKAIITGLFSPGLHKRYIVQSATFVTVLMLFTINRWCLSTREIITDTMSVSHVKLCVNKPRETNSVQV